MRFLPTHLLLWTAYHLNSMYSFSKYNNIHFEGGEGERETMILYADFWINNLIPSPFSYLSTLNLTFFDVSQARVVSPLLSNNLQTKQHTIRQIQEIPKVLNNAHSGKWTVYWYTHKFIAYTNIKHRWSWHKIKPVFLVQSSVFLFCFFLFKNHLHSNQ